MSYFNHLKYQDMAKDLDTFFKEKKRVVNFDIIYQECCGDPLQKTYKEHKTVDSKNFENYPKKDEKKSTFFNFLQIGMICGLKEI